MNDYESYVSGLDFVGAAIDPSKLSATTLRNVAAALRNEPNQGAHALVSLGRGYTGRPANVSPGAPGPDRLTAAAMASSLPQIFLGADSGDGGAANIAAGATGTVTVESDVPFRITDLIVQGAFAADFLITRMSVGRLNLFANNQAIPADAFVSGVQRPPIETPELQAGTEASITVTNTAGASRRFVAMFCGIDMTPPRRGWRDTLGG